VGEVAYTVGYTESYDQYLRDDPKPGKLGARSGYDGGYVWMFPWQAADFLRSPIFASTSRKWEHYSVYQIELPTSWAVDVSPRTHHFDGVHRLLNDAKIVKRVEVGASP
jgi:hypothetical protein